MKKKNKKINIRLSHFFSSLRQMFEGLFLDPHLRSTRCLEVGR